LPRTCGAFDEELPVERREKLPPSRLLLPLFPENERTELLPPRKERELEPLLLPSEREMEPLFPRLDERPLSKERGEDPLPLPPLKLERGDGLKLRLLLPRPEEPIDDERLLPPPPLEERIELPPCPPPPLKECDDPPPLDRDEDPPPPPPPRFP